MNPQIQSRNTPHKVAPANRRRGLVPARILIGVLAGGLALNTRAELSVRVNIPSCTLSVVRRGALVAAYPVRVGTPGSPTPVGKGKIVEKRKQVVFRYLEGERLGEIITRSYIVPTGQTIKMPYDRLRGLLVELDDGDSVVIHSTTEYWTVGLPVSHKCIGMRIDDMLGLFDLLTEVPTDIAITYDTVEVNDAQLRFYPDLYNRATNRLAEVLAQGVSVRDRTSAQNRLQMIERDLAGNLAEALRRLRAGRDASALCSSLCLKVAVEQFLEVIQLDYRGRQRSARFDLRGRNLLWD